jgi:hypothetical protein
MNATPSVDDKETVVRILHKEWVVDGQLQITAFGLRQGESYISVNRPAIDTFLSDVSDFVSKHADYKSHAGIFTRYDDKNIKGGQDAIQDKNDSLMPARAILLKVQHQLLALSTLEQHEMSLSKTPCHL